jgi:hypothetical protein
MVPAAGAGRQTQPLRHLTHAFSGDADARRDFDERQSL